MTDTSPLDNAFHNATVSLQGINIYKQTKAERLLDRLGM